MSVNAEPLGINALPAWVRRSWATPLVLGILLLLAGLVLVVDVGAGIDTLRWLVVIDLVLAAVQAFATASLRSRRWVGGLVGLLYLATAVVGIVWPGITLLALVLTVGVALLVGGAVQTGAAWTVRRVDHGWGWSLTLGLISVLGGLLFLFGNPGISLVALAIVLAFYTIVAGVTLLALAVKVHRQASTFSSAALSS